MNPAASEWTPEIANKQRNVMNMNSYLKEINAVRMENMNSEAEMDKLLEEVDISRAVNMPANSRKSRRASRSRKNRKGRKSRKASRR